MTKLTTEFLSKLQDSLLQFQDSYSDPADKENYGIFVDALHVLDEFKAAKEKLIAYEQAAEKPYGYLEPCDFPRTTATVYPEKDKYAFMPLYAAPVLPKQPGLLSIGELLHRLEEQTGEKWVEESAQPIIPERLIQAINRLLDNDGSRGCFDALEQHRAKTELELLLAAAQQNEPQNIPENIPEQPVSELRARAISLYKPPFKFDFGYIWDADGQMVADQNLNEDGQILRVRGWGRISYLENPEALQDEVGEVIALALSNYWNLHIAADLIQPVSEPYKLPDGWVMVPEEATIAMLTLLGLTGSFDFMQQKYKNMLAAAPAQESE